MAEYNARRVSRQGKANEIGHGSVIGARVRDAKIENGGEARANDARIKDVNGRRRSKASAGDEVEDNEGQATHVLQRVFFLERASAQYSQVLLVFCVQRQKGPNELFSSLRNPELYMVLHFNYRKNASPVKAEYDLHGTLGSQGNDYRCQVDMPCSAD